MLVRDFVDFIDRLAPLHLAQPWDNSGLLVGDEDSQVRSVLCSLELSETVLDEAVGGSFDLVLTHHPLLFKPVGSLVEANPQERLLRGLVRNAKALVACHTNVDVAVGGIADIVAAALGLRDTSPLETASAGWVKFVGFVPEESLERVAAAVFASGAGGIGPYSECGFSVHGTGWFTPGQGSAPVVGAVGVPERAPEVRWETVVPRERSGAAVRAFVSAHPYEEPAFDLYPVEDVLPLVGLGRTGKLAEPASVAELVSRVAELFALPAVAWTGDGTKLVRTVGVLPGSGRGSVEKAAGRCDVLISGDLGHHDAEVAGQRGMAIIDAPHADLEWWAFKKWCEGLASHLESEGVALELSKVWRSPWNRSKTG